MIGRLKHTLALGAAGLALAAAVALPGCSSTDTKLTPKEESMFQGTGQMPPEAQKRMAEKMAEARSKMQQQQPGPGNAPK